MSECNKCKCVKEAQSPSAVVVVVGNDEAEVGYGVVVLDPDNSTCVLPLSDAYGPAEEADAIGARKEAELPERWNTV